MLTKILPFWHFYCLFSWVLFFCDFLKRSVLYTWKFLCCKPVVFGSWILRKKFSGINLKHHSFPSLKLLELFACNLVGSNGYYEFSKLLRKHSCKICPCCIRHWSHQMSSWENEMWIYRDRVGDEAAIIFKFNCSSGKCSVMPKDLPPEPYWIF